MVCTRKSKTPHPSAWELRCTLFPLEGKQIYQKFSQLIPRDYSVFLHKAKISPRRGRTQKLNQKISVFTRFEGFLNRKMVGFLTKNIIMVGHPNPSPRFTSTFRNSPYLEDPSEHNLFLLTLYQPS